MIEEKLMERVRALLAKAEDEGCTPAESEALSEKAAELMAKYGIKRAMFGALHPESDKPADRIFELPNPWGAVKAHLLGGLGRAMRCQAIRLNASKANPGVVRIHLFGYQSDLDRVDMLFTSLLVQMHRALAQQYIPMDARSDRAWRRSYQLGYVAAVVAKVSAVEQRVTEQAKADDVPGGTSTALVLVDRSVAVQQRTSQAYPRTRTTRVTFTGNGFAGGYKDGQRADIGGAKVGGRARGTLGS